MNFVCFYDKIKTSKAIGEEPTIEERIDFMETRRKYKIDITDGGSNGEYSIAVLQVKGMFLLPPEAAKNNYHITGRTISEFITQFERIVMSSEWSNEPTIKATNNLIKRLKMAGVTVMGANFPSTPGEGCVYWLKIELSAEKHSPEKLIDLVKEGLNITDKEEIEVFRF